MLGEPLRDREPFRMDIKTIKRIIYRLFPEFVSDWHLPHLAKIVALPELPEEGQESDRFNPRYAADVILLDSNFVERKDVDIFQAVPLPVFGIGPNAGRFEPPSVGSIVEVTFVQGNPSLPIIRGVYSYGFALPSIKQGEYKVQTQAGVYRHIDVDGNFYDVTCKLASLQCKLRQVKTSQSQEYQSPKTWIGSDKENVLTLLSETIETLINLSTLCANHAHTSTSPGSPTSASQSDFASAGAQADAIKKRLDPITK